MYYEEKVVFGCLQYRTRPDGEWTPLDTAKGRAFLVMADLTKEDCYDIIRHLEL